MFLSWRRGEATLAGSKIKGAHHQCPLEPKDHRPKTTAIGGSPYHHPWHQGSPQCPWQHTTLMQTRGEGGTPPLVRKAESTQKKLKGPLGAECHKGGPKLGVYFLKSRKLTCRYMCRHEASDIYYIYIYIYIHITNICMGRLYIYIHNRGGLFPLYASSLYKV